MNEFEELSKKMVSEMSAEELCNITAIAPLSLYRVACREIKAGDNELKTGVVISREAISRLQERPIVVNVNYDYSKYNN